MARTLGVGKHAGRAVNVRGTAEAVARRIDMDRTRDRAIRKVIVLAVGTLHLAGMLPATQPADDGYYVGSEACLDCHPDEYQSYLNFAKKAKSYDAVKKMQPKLTPSEYRGCLKCHTTGYGEPGGFRSEEETPELRNAGCEVCHGPGGRHATSAQATDIRGQLTRSVCESCHSQERVEAFEYKPLIFGGGH